METPPNLQVYDLGHLGLVASVLGRIRLVETVDHLPGFARATPGASYSCALSAIYCAWKRGRAPSARWR
jgi:hypothetical protein